LEPACEMSKFDVGKFIQEEPLKEAIALLTKQKEQIQDYLLERMSIAPEQELADIIREFKVSKELAQAIFVMEFDYNINRKFSANFYNYELKRLEKVHFELPSIPSFLLRFSLEEGFWIKYLTIDLLKKLRLKISKLLALDRSLFGHSKGSKEDSALYILERIFLIENIIKPLLIFWIKDHHSATCYDAAASFLCSIQGKAMEKAPKIVEDLCNRFYANISSLKEIIMALDANGWAGKAIIQYNQIEEELQCCTHDLVEMSWRIASELVLEAFILLEYNLLDNTVELISEMQKNAKNTLRSEEVFQQKEKDLITDKLVRVLLAFDDLPKEKRPEVIADLINEDYRKAFLTNHQKPSLFGKSFLKRLTTLLQLDMREEQRIIKRFDSQLMYRLSPIGAKEFPRTSVDEKVLSLLNEIVLEVLEGSPSYQTIIATQLAKGHKQSSSLQGKSVLDFKPVEEPLGAKMKKLPEKKLWFLIRDFYLKELFDETDELLASARVLKKLSLELGLLLTENEAQMILAKALKAKDIAIDGSDKETLDKELCKSILKELKQLIQ